MDDKEFQAMMGDLAAYLDVPKAFALNPDRFADVKVAFETAKKLFAHMDVSINDDPLQMGALILRIEGFDVTVRGKEEIELFTELIAKADNFEIYPVGDESVKFAIVFNGVLTRIPASNKLQ